MHAPVFPVFSNSVRLDRFGLMLCPVQYATKTKGGCLLGTIHKRWMRLGTLGRSGAEGRTYHLCKPRISTHSRKFAQRRSCQCLLDSPERGCGFSYNNPGGSSSSTLRTPAASSSLLPPQTPGYPRQSLADFLSQAGPSGARFSTTYAPDPGRKI